MRPVLTHMQGGIWRDGGTVHVLVTGTPDSPPLEFSFVSQGGICLKSPWNPLSQMLAAGSKLFMKCDRS